MTVGKAIYNLLLSNAALRAIVDTRIFPEVAQQDAELPYVVYNISSNEPSDTKREPSKMDTAQVEINLYSTSYTECIDMATHVRAALDRVTGTYSGVNVQSIQYLGEVINFDEAQRAYNITSDYDVRVSRSDFEIAQGSPITGVTLGELSDVDTTGVTDGQVIAYDAAAQEWQPADDAGGVTQLGQLDDVTLNNTAQGELLKYDGNDWVNDTIDKSDVSLGNVDNTSDADKPISTATQTALDDKADSSDVPTELDDLSDVKIIGAPSAGQSLVYNSGFFQLGQAGATTLGALDDVNTVGAAFGSLLAYNGSTGWDISAAALPTDDVYFHQRYVTESEALRSGATATVELYFACTAQGNGLAEDAESDTPTAGKIINRKIYYSESAFADPDTGTWVEFTPAPADDASFATVKAALLEYLKARTGGTVPISLKQTWEEADEANLLLDTYTGAAAAYSLRKLRTAYTGDAVEVYNGSSYADIGFSNDELDTTALAAHCGSNDGFVSKWYDQSSNSVTVSQTNTGKMPKIYDGQNGVVTENGKPTISAYGGGTVRTLGTTVSSDLLHTNNEFSQVAVFEASSSGHVFLNNLYTTFPNWRVRSGGSTTSTAATPTALTGGNNVFSQTVGFLSRSGDTVQSYENNVLAINGTDTASVTTFNAGVGLARLRYEGNVQELVIWNSAQSDRTGIQTNIATFYGITI